MTRVFLTVDETSPIKPTAVLHINGFEMQLSELELRGLSNEIQWALVGITEARKNNWSNLATKYREIENVTT